MDSTLVDRASIAASVLDIVREALFLPPEQAAQVSLGSSFVNDLMIDSLTMVRIDMLVQNRLHLAIPVEEATSVDTIDDLVELLVTRGRPVAENGAG